MDIARGPTDNLYKFLALSGVALMCIGIVQVNNLLSARTTADIEANVSAQSIKYLSEAITITIGNRTRLLASQAKTVTNDTVNTAAIVELLEKERAMSEQWFEDVQDWTTVSRDARIKTETVFAIERSFKGRIFAYLLIILLGGILMSIGFLLWYYRLQKYLDAKLRVENPIPTRT